MDRTDSNQILGSSGRGRFPRAMAKDRLVILIGHDADVEHFLSHFFFLSFLTYDPSSTSRQKSSSKRLADSYS